MARTRLVIGVLLLGVGLGGFFDGIVLHQILQWHHMLSEVEPPTSLSRMELNVMADGLFHAATYVATVAGVALVWSAARGTRGTTWSWHILAGGLLAGWGLFNLVEGVIDHHILQVHHVRSGPDELAWDLGFLAWGAVMLVVGGLLMRSGLEGLHQREHADSTEPADTHRTA
ncbi:MAG: DUF2243 domain-containing protein [Dehalococcoidia bacterium]